MDYNELKLWLDLAQWIATILLGLFVWIDKRRKDNTDKIDQLKLGQEKLNHRLVKVEVHARLAPTHEDITALREQNASTQSKLDRVTNTLDRIHDHLMNKG